MVGIETLISTFGGGLWIAFFFVIALSIIVAIHEYGHYIVGRWSGIYAEVFSVGFGPVLLSRTDKRGTVWQLAAVPFGGYVKFKGDASAASTPDRSKLNDMERAELRSTMHGAPLWARSVTAAAGPVFNFIFSILIFVTIFMVQGRPTDSLIIENMPNFPYGHTIQIGDEILELDGSPVTNISEFAGLANQTSAQASIPYRVLRDGTALDVTGPYPLPAVAASVSPQSAAISAGLKAGDVILRANDQPTYSFSQLQTIVAAANGGIVKFDVWRDGQELSFDIAPKRSDIPKAEGGFETRWLIGISGGLFFQTGFEAVGFTDAFFAALDRVWFIITSTFSGMWHMITGAISTCNLSGPLTIAETSGQVASLGLYTFLSFLAVISTAIGLMNLFPIPMLDGGHLVFFAYEAIFRKPPSEKAYQILMSIGVGLVVSLMIFALTNDLFCP